MNVAWGCAMNVSDLFRNFPYEKVSITNEQIKTLSDKYNKRNLLHHMFTDCVNLVLDDVIDNNATFRLPVYGVVGAEIHMALIKGKHFKCAMRKGNFPGLDFIITNFTGYRPAFYMFGKRTPRLKFIYVDKERREKIINLANSGKTWC